MVTIVDERKLETYLGFHHNQFLYQKAGYILSYFHKMKLSKSFFKRCHSHIGKSIRYLSMDNRWENPIYHAFWQLYAPEDLLKTMEQGANADV